MASVHASSVVDPRARVAESVSVGPFCVVGPDVVLEDGVVLDSHVRVEGHTTLGAGVRVHAGAVLGGPPQDLKFKPETKSHLTIGEGTVVRECATANVASDEGAFTRVGAHCLLMAYSHVAHNTVLGDRVILANAVQLAGYVTIEDWAIVGGGTVVHQFVRIGAHSMIGGGCRVPQDVAPFVRAAGYPLGPIGLNVVGLERRGFSPDDIKGLKQAYRILFRSNLKVEDAVAQMRSEIAPSPHVEQLARFALESERGLAR
jgi:UDP-N-acetylglucosamine acyltransferase